MATSSYASLFGTTGSGSQPGISTLFGQQEAPKTQEAQTTQQQPQTFAQMQQAGQARPAPPTSYGGLMGQLQTQLQQQLAQPSGYNAQQIQQLRQQQQQQLSAQFEQQQKALNEEMARRGISASSIAGGRLGDLYGQQARAATEFESNLLQSQQAAEERRQQGILQALQSMAGLAGTQEAQTARLEQEAAQSALERELRTKMQREQLTSQEQQLLKEIESRKALQTAQLTQETTQAQAERQLRERLGMAELTGTVSMTNPDGTTTQVNTLAAQRLGQEGMALRLQQAAQMSQQTGQVYELDRDGNVVPKTFNGQPVRTESALARLSQEELQRAELTGTIMRDGVAVPTLAAQRLTQEQLNALRDQALRQSQATGVMYRINAAGTGIEEDRDAQGNPVSTEQRRAQQAQELTQARQLATQQAESLSRQTGLAYKVGDDGRVTADMDPATGRQRTTVEAQQLKQQADLQIRQLEQQRDLALMEMGGRLPVIDPATGQQQRDANGNPVFQETVQSRQLRQQYEMQLAELRGYMEMPGPNGTTVRVDTLASRQLDQQRLQALAAQAIERSQLTGFVYRVGADGTIQQEFDGNTPVMTAQARQADLDRQLRETLGRAEYTGMYQGQQTMQAQQQQQNLLIQLAGILAQGGAATQGQMPDLMRQLYTAFGLTPPPVTTSATQAPGTPAVGQLSPDGAYRWTGTSWVPNTTQTGQTGSTDTTVTTRTGTEA